MNSDTESKPSNIQPQYYFRITYYPGIHEPQKEIRVAAPQLKFVLEWLSGYNITIED